MGRTRGGACLGSPRPGSTHRPSFTHRPSGAGRSRSGTGPGLAGGACAPGGYRLRAAPEVSRGPCSGAWRGARETLAKRPAPPCAGRCQSVGPGASCLGSHQGKLWARPCSGPPARCSDPGPQGNAGRSGGYLPALRCQRVALSIFLCFFFRMRLRRFFIRDPMSALSVAGARR